MSFDAFEARLHFLQLLRKLNASQPSIQKVVSYAIKYGSRCGEDLWECITEECSKGSLNTRINILYFLDSLLEACQPLAPRDAPYLGFIGRDLGDIVERVVPDTREGVLNMKSARQILDSWRLRRLVDPHLVEEVIHKLETRKHDSSSPKKRSHEETFSRTDILRRMEEDRERHKRLRERIWILPIPPIHPNPIRSLPSRSAAAATTISYFQSPSSTSPGTPASPSGRRPAPPSSSATQTAPAATSASGSSGDAGRMRPPPVPPIPGSNGAANGGADTGLGADPLSVEFEVMWETGSDLDEEDYVTMRELARISRAETGVR